MNPIFIVFFILPILANAQVSGASVLDEKKLAEGLDRIEVWPAGTTNYSGWQQLIAFARVVQKCDTNSVEAALRKYQGTNSSSIEQTTEELDRNDKKLFLLMRVIFELPSSAPPQESVRFGRWVTWGTEVNKDGTVNIGWPIRWEQGRPTLVSGFAGLQGVRARYKLLVNIGSFVASIR